MFGVHTYIVWDNQTNEAMIIDPGMINSNDNKAIDNLIATNNLKLKYLVNTHMHIDHTFGDDYIKQKYALPLYAHEAERRFGLSREVQARQFGFNISIPAIDIDRPINDGDVFTIGDKAITALHTPGHSPGSISFYAANDNIIFVGDVLFRSSIGRTDLAMGNHTQLLTSIDEKLMVLPDSTIVYPGHGPHTTIGFERVHNPYIV
jgi:glyoxylase-like metal-dependent hydrolase (beta-lactamase superfamily II)